MKWYRRIFFLFFCQMKSYLGRAALPELWATTGLSAIALLNVLSVAALIGRIVDTPFVGNLSVPILMLMIGAISFVIYTRMAMAEPLRRIETEFACEASLILARVTAVIYLGSSLLVFCVAVD